MLFQAAMSESLVKVWEREYGKSAVEVAMGRGGKKSAERGLSGGLSRFGCEDRGSSWRLRDLKGEFRNFRRDVSGRFGCECS